VRARAPEVKIASAVFDSRVRRNRAGGLDVVVVVVVEVVVFSFFFFLFSLTRKM
jgi:hypothetical protein